jgi:hypothetical protein
MPLSHQEAPQTTKPAGPGGRITEVDVRAYLDERDAGTVPLTGPPGIIARRMVASLQGSTALS